MIKVTLEDLFNVANFEAKKTPPEKDEIRLKIRNKIEGGKAAPEVEFSGPAKKNAAPAK